MDQRVEDMQSKVSELEAKISGAPPSRIVSKERLATLMARLEVID
jgi:hypothetical protein